METLSYLFDSIVILADRPLLLGDRVKINAYEGVVEHISIRCKLDRRRTGSQSKLMREYRIQFCH